MKTDLKCLWFHPCVHELGNSLFVIPLIGSLWDTAVCWGPFIGVFHRSDGSLNHRNFLLIVWIKMKFKIPFLDRMFPWLRSVKNTIIEDITKLCLFSIQSFKQFNLHCMIIRWIVLPTYSFSPGKNSRARHTIWGTSSSSSNFWSWIRNLLLAL